MENPYILLVEDNEDDAFLIERAFQRANILNGLRAVKNGEEAISYLSGRGSYANRTDHPLPRLVLLDLKMPGIDGFDVLRWIRGQSELRGLRVVVLTSSTDVRDVNQAIQSGADGFMIKPADFLRLVEFSEALAGCWIWTQDGPGRTGSIGPFPGGARALQSLALD